MQNEFVRYRRFNSDCPGVDFLFATQLAARRQGGGTPDTSVVEFAPGPMPRELNERISSARSSILRKLLSCAALLLTGGALLGQPNFIGVDYIGNVYTISPTTGTGSLIGINGVAGLNALAADNSGRLLAAGGSGAAFPIPGLVVIDPATGHILSSTPLTFPNRITDVRALAFSADGTLYAINHSGGFGILQDELYTINLGTGRATLVGSTGMANIQGLDFSPQGLLYAWAADDGSGTGKGLLTINPITGLATDVNPALGAPVDIQSIVFASDGGLYGARNALYRIDAGSGAVTLIGSGGYSDVRGLEVVPEPSWAALLISGIGVAVVIRRWKRAHDLCLQRGVRLINGATW